jgi:hypothetical protein
MCKFWEIVVNLVQVIFWALVVWGIYCLTTTLWHKLLAPETTPGWRYIHLMALLAISAACLFFMAAILKGKGFWFKVSK